MEAGFIHAQALPGAARRLARISPRTELIWQAMPSGIPNCSVPQRRCLGLLQLRQLQEPETIRADDARR